MSITPYAELKAPAEVSTDLAALRAEIRLKPVTVESFTKHPVEQFLSWFKDACDAKAMMPNSMVLSTAEIRNGVARPSSRAVLLKDIIHGTKVIPVDVYMHPSSPSAVTLDAARYFSDASRELPAQGAFTFCTNFESRKGNEITGNPYGSLYFIWHELERAVRVEGPIVQAPSPLSDHYHNTRPRTSRIAAYTSQQSRPVDSYEEFTRRYETLLEDFNSKRAASENPTNDQDVPRPAHWGGFMLEPQRIEFWQGRPSRTHERLEYQLEEGGQWHTQFLQP